MGALKGQLLALPETLSYSLELSGSSPVGDQLISSVRSGAASTIPLIFTSGSRSEAQQVDNENLRPARAINEF